MVGWRGRVAHHHPMLLTSREGGSCKASPERARGIRSEGIRGRSDGAPEGCRRVCCAWWCGLGRGVAGREGEGAPSAQCFAPPEHQTHLRATRRISRTQLKLSKLGVRAGRASMRGARCVRAALSDARLPNPINELYPARWGRAHMLARSPGVAPQRRQSPFCAICDSPLGAKKGTSHQ